MAATCSKSGADWDWSFRSPIVAQIFRTIHIGMPNIYFFYGGLGLSFPLSLLSFVGSETDTDGE